MKLVRPLITVAILLAVWQALVTLTGVPRYILPSPGLVGRTLIEMWPVIGRHALITLTEILLGLVLGSALGAVSALLIAQVPVARRWLLPLIVASQAIPVFALAPILVLWLGYGMASKIAMTMVIIFFPVTTAFYDGLRRTDPGWLELARTMSGTPWRVLWRIRLPSALPALGSGLRMAAAVAPIGAIIGEWVGASSGLGFLMLHANARMQTDLMFASLAVLAVLAVGLYAGVDSLVRRLLPWLPETLPDSNED